MDIQKIAKLSGLTIDEAELEKFEKDMNEITEMFSELPQIDDELFPDETEKMTLRADKTDSGNFTRDELLSNAAAVESGLFVVPKTV